MNKSQQEYARGRVRKILEMKKLEITAKHTKEAKSLTSEERANLLRSGKVKLRPDVTKIESYTDVTDVFDFSKYAWPRAIDTAAVEKAMAPLEAEATAIEDQIVLGDGSEALAAIERFAALCAK